MSYRGILIIREHKCFLVCPRARNICCRRKFCSGHNCFPVCASQETSWATMCHGLKKLFFEIHHLKVFREPWRPWIINWNAWFHYSILHDYVKRVPQKLWCFFGMLQNVVVRVIYREWFRYAACNLGPLKSKSTLLFYFRDSETWSFDFCYPSLTIFFVYEPCQKPPNKTLLE